MTNINGQGRWKLLSLGLLLTLAVSAGINVYSTFSPRSGEEPGDSFDFIFTWGPDKQKIVNGTFRLEMNMTVVGGNLTILIKANDDEYNEEDYVGLVFDMDGNGYVDLGDESYGLWANNCTVPSILLRAGWLGFAQVRPHLGPQKVTFTNETGYTYDIEFPYLLNENQVWNPVSTLKNGTDNPLHICFQDVSAACSLAGSLGVFTTFLFHYTGSMS